jgi:integrase
MGGRGRRKITLPDGSEGEAPWLVGLRDRALIGVMVYTFARISAVLAMRVEDYFPNGKRWWVRLQEKGGKRCGNRVPPLTVEALGDHREAAREQLPPYWALFAPGQLRWTTVGILSGVCAGTAYFLISVLLPKALVDQHMAVSLSSGLTSLIYAASITGKAFTGLDSA